MLDKIGWGTYIFFAAFCLIAFIFTYLFVPETRGKVRIIFCLLRTLCTSTNLNAFLLDVGGDGQCLWRY